MILVSSALSDSSTPELGSVAAGTSWARSRSGGTRTDSGSESIWTVAAAARRDRGAEIGLPGCGGCEAEAQGREQVAGQPRRGGRHSGHEGQLAGDGDGAVRSDVGDDLLDLDGVRRPARRARPRRSTGGHEVLILSAGQEDANASKRSASLMVSRARCSGRRTVSKIASDSLPAIAAARPPTNLATTATPPRVDVESMNSAASDRSVAIRLGVEGREPVADGELAVEQREAGGGIDQGGTRVLRR